MAFNLFDLGQALNAGAGAVNNFRQQRLLGDLGGKLKSGDYSGAAQTALAAGDVGTGIKLLTLGQQVEGDKKSMELAGLGGGGDAVSLAPQPMGTGNYRDAIASIESRGSGDYVAIGPETRGDRAYGRYQVMGKNIPLWTQRALGTAMTPDQFLKSPEAQDKVFDTVFGGYAQKYGNPQDAASAWFTGRPLAEGANRRDVNGVSGQQYASRFTQALGGGKNVQVADASGRIPQSAGDANQYDARLMNLARARAAAKSDSQKAAIEALIKIEERKQTRADKQENIGVQRENMRENRAMRQQQFDAAQQERELRRQERTDKLAAEGAARSEKLTESQAKSGVYYTENDASHKLLNDPKILVGGLGMQGAIGRSVAAIPGVGPTVAPETTKQFNQAADNFVSNVVYAKSGASASVAEYDRAFRQYIPTPTDGPDQITQKTEARKRWLDQMKISAGPAVKDGGGATTPKTTGGGIKLPAGWSVEVH